MINRLTKFAAIITLAALLGGCYPSEKKETTTDSSVGNTEQSGVSSPDSEQSVQLQTENVTFDLNAPANIPGEVPSIKLTLKKWDKNELERLLLDGKEIEEQIERDCQFYPGEKHYSYDTKDQLRIIFEPGWLVIDDKDALGGKYKYGSVFNYPENCTASDEELDAFSREDAVNRVNALIDKLGITNYGEPLITPIKADFANEVLASRVGHKDKQGNEFEYTPWTTDEEMYVLNYPFVFENTELAMFGFGIPQSTNKVSEPPCINAVVTKDKIISFSANGVYSASYETVENIPINYDYNKIFYELKKFYSNFVPEQPITYYSGKSVYIPREMTDDEMTVTFVPGWEFLGYSELWDMPSPFDRHQEYQYFYADTGYRYIEN